MRQTQEGRRAQLCPCMTIAVAFHHIFKQFVKVRVSGQQENWALLLSCLLSAAHFTHRWSEQKSSVIEVRCAEKAEGCKLSSEALKRYLSRNETFCVLKWDSLCPSVKHRDSYVGVSHSYGEVGVIKVTKGWLGAMGKTSTLTPRGNSNDEDWRQNVL